MRSGIIAGGNWLVDHVKLIDQWPPQDGLAHILSRAAGNGAGRARTQKLTTVETPIKWLSFLKLPSFTSSNTGWLARS